MNEKLRVAAYVRIGQSEVDTIPNYEIAKRHYDEMVTAHENWELCGIYADVGAGTKTAPRPEFKRLLSNCYNGSIDLIVTKSIRTLFQNLLDVIALVKELEHLNPPVGFYFEDTDIYTLNASDDRYFLHIMKLASEDKKLKKYIGPPVNLERFFIWK